MSKPVITIEPSRTVLDACKVMAKRNIGSLVVVEKGKPVGVITERDVINKVLGKSKNPAKFLVEQVMTPRVRTVELHDSVMDVSSIMKENNYRRIIVMDAKHIAGIITARDLIRIYSS